MKTAPVTQVSDSRASSTRRSRRRGAIIPLTAISLTLLLGMAAFALDVGRMMEARTQLQCAADAAALAGAMTLSSGTATAQTAAQDAGQANNTLGIAVSITSSADVVFGTWNKSTLTFTALGGGTTAANAVQVTCRMSQARGTGLPLLFGQIFSVSSVDINAKAVAINVSSPGCGFVGLTSVQFSGGSWTDSYNSSVAGYTGGSATKDGNVCSNSNIQMSGGSTIINGNATPGPGYSLQTSGGASVTGLTTPATAALSEAAINSGNAATVNNNSNIPLTAKGNNAVDSHGNFALSGGDSVTLPAGTYYFSTLQLSGGSTITLSGQTIIYVTGQIDLSGGSVTNTSELASDFQLYCMGSQVNISGSSALYASIYAPGAAIQDSGSAQFYGALVGDSLQVSGGGGLHYDTALGGASNGAQLVR